MLSRRAGERVMGLLRGLFSRLRVNDKKSAVALATSRKPLGYSLWYGTGPGVKHRVADQAIAAMKERVRQITRRTGGRSLRHTVEELRECPLGWREYCRLADTPQVFRTLDEWIRHRLRVCLLKQWKRGRTVDREPRARGGASEQTAVCVAVDARRWWKNSAMRLHLALPNGYFDGLRLPRLGR